MFTFPPINRSTLPNGMDIVWVADREQRALTIALQIPAGEFFDPISFEGTAELTMALMQKGTRDLTSEQFAEKLEQTGASLFAETGDEHMVVGCKMLSVHAGEVIPLFWNMVCFPRFDESELTRLKREMITGLQAEMTDPNALANKHFYPLLCGKEHPAGRLHTMASIKRIGLTEIKAFYSSHFSPQSSMLVIAGERARPETEGAWVELFSSWRAPRLAKPCIGEPIEPRGKTIIRLVDKPDITQTYFLLGHPMPGELHAMRNELALANYILGGGNFSSRLMDRIRSENGKTYGISSQIVCNRNCGIFMISTATLSSQTAEVLSSILDVYREFSSKGVTEQELSKAKEFAIGNLAFQLEGIGNIAEKLLWLNLYDRQISFIEQFDSIIASIGLDAVNQAIKDHLSSSGFSVVAVGPKRAIESQLAKIGPVSSMHFRALP